MKENKKKTGSQCLKNIFSNFYFLPNQYPTLFLVYFRVKDFLQYVLSYSTWAKLSWRLDLIPPTFNDFSFNAFIQNLLQTVGLTVSNYKRSLQSGVTSSDAQNFFLKTFISHLEALTIVKVPKSVPYYPVCSKPM